MNNLKRASLVLLLIFVPLILCVAIGFTNASNPESGGFSVIFSSLAGIVCAALTAVAGLITSLLYETIRWSCADNALSCCIRCLQDDSPVL